MDLLIPAELQVLMRAGEEEETEVVVWSKLWVIMSPVDHRWVTDLGEEPQENYRHLSS